MDLQLKDKIAIVGGGSDGIGHGIAMALAAEGAQVAIYARREAGVSRAAQAIREATGAEVLGLQADAKSADDCARVIEKAAAHFGGLDIVVNNDGAPPLGAISSFDDAAWQKAVEQNLMYAIRMSRGALPHLQRRGGGSILNITAISAIQPIAGFGLSVATWAGVIGFAKTLSLEAAPMNISVNTICPGYIETKRLEKVFTGDDPQAMRRKLVSEIPLGRIGTVADVANLVAYLVSPLGRYVTGTTIQVDGGLLRALR
jgi:3-oxoacyl-[acyl-carrier protein] reductase